MAMHADPLPTDFDPWAIARDPALDAQTKFQRLRDLEYFVRQVQVATEEGMQGDSALPSLEQVQAALVHVRPNAEPAEPPTKM